MDVYKYIGISLICYLIGSIPFAVLIGRMYGVDVRKVGSGNPGATNVYRTAGRFPGVLTLLLDFLKCFMPVLILKNLNENYAIAGGFCGVLGHMFSPFLKFNGGKGVASYVGFILAIAPYSFLIFIIVFVIVLLITKYVSLSSILASILSSIGYVIIYGISVFTIIIPILAGVIVMRHHSNIKKLINGNEHKFKL